MLAGRARHYEVSVHTAGHDLLTVLPVFVTTCSITKAVSAVTGQFVDKPTRGQSSCGLVNLRTSQLAEMFDYNLQYIIAISVISDRLHYLYTVNIGQGYSYC